MDLYPLLIGAIIGFFVVNFIALTKKSSTIKKESVNRITPLLTELTISEAMEVIKNFAQFNNYKIEIIDKIKNQIVLSDSRIGVLMYGKFYPIYFSTRKDGKTIVEIGIKSKVGSSADLSTKKNHTDCVNGIQNALEVYGKQ